MPQLNEDDNVVVVPKRKMETVTGEMVHATEQDAKELKELIELSSDSDDEPQPKKLAKSTLVVDSDEDDSEDSDEDKPYHATASNRTRSFVGLFPVTVKCWWCRTTISIMWKSTTWRRRS